MSTDAPPRLRIDALRITLPDGAVIGPVDATLRAGECLALVGESGSGKSLTLLALLGLLPPALRVSGRFWLDGVEVALGTPAQAALRGNGLALMPQDPLAALHPLRRIGAQLVETLRTVGGVARAGAPAAARALLQRCGLDPALAFDAWPHRLSGGQRQRALLALTLAAGPRVLLADELTSALDAALARNALDALDALRADGLALVLVSHDLPQVARVADRVIVLQRGRVVEQGCGHDVLAAPQAAYTRALLSARPPPRDDAADVQRAAPLLRIDHLRLRYPGARDEALRGIDLDIARGETVALVGGSGSGKSTLGRALLRLARPARGSRIRFDGQSLETLGERALRPLRRRLQVVFQDPYASLDPRQRVVDIVREPLRVHGLGDAAAQRARVAALLAAVGLPADAIDRYPAQFSGGQRQRIAIARALASDPELLVCDEAISALDAQVQAQVLALLLRLQRERGLAMLFITHDLEAAAAIAHRIAVMEDGRIVEVGPAAALLATPRHPCTRRLLAARASAP